MRLFVKGNELNIKCLHPECIEFIEADLSKIEKKEIINCKAGHSHMIEVVFKVADMYELKINPIGSEGSYL